MAWGTCLTCGERDELDQTKFMAHRCKPRWLVREHGKYRNWGDDWHDIYARDAEAAATKFGEMYDEGDYPIVQGSPLTVMVKDPATGRAEAYIIYGEHVPSYSASPDDTGIKPRIEPREVNWVTKRTRLERAAGLEPATNSLEG